MRGIGRMGVMEVEGCRTAASGVRKRRRRSRTEQHERRLALASSSAAHSMCWRGDGNANRIGASRWVDVAAAGPVDTAALRENARKFKLCTKYARRFLKMRGFKRMGGWRRGQRLLIRRRSEALADRRRLLRETRGRGSQTAATGWIMSLVTSAATKRKIFNNQ